MRALVLAALATAAPLQGQARIQRFTLPNGLRVLHLEDHEHPLVRGRLHLRLEPEDGSDLQGQAAALLQAMTLADTADLKAAAFDRLLEEAGIQLGASTDPVGLSWRLVCRSRDIDRAMGLLGDRLLRTLFTPALLTSPGLPRGRQASDLEEPPRERLRRALEPGAGAAAALPGPAALLAFRDQVLRPDRAVLILHGDLGLEQARRLVMLSLGTWTTPPAQDTPAPKTLPTPGNPAPVRIPAPGHGLRLQARAALPAQASQEAAALLRLLVPGAPLLEPLGVSSEGEALWATLDAEPGTAAAAWTLFQERLQALLRRGFTALDLARAKAVWKARRSLLSLHPEAQMDAVLAEVLGRGASEGAMELLTLDQLNTTFRSWLDPAVLRVGAAGDPADLKALPSPPAVAP